jgi:non-heme chloroperoxidase
MKTRANRIIVVILCAAFIPMAVIAALIIFGTAKPKAAALKITAPFSAMDKYALPGLQRYQSRDGAQLSYREYLTAPGRCAVLIHGSAGSSEDMHLLAVALQRAGVNVLVPDMRGHGANWPHGDISYVGQLDDDLADFLVKEKPKFLNQSFTLVGFSSGGAFALRIAAEVPLSKQFDRYIFVSPYLRYDAPSVRRGPAQKSEAVDKSAANDVQTWATASTGRIIGLTILDAFHVHFLDGLPVLTFPVPDNVEATTRSYSWRMQQNFGAHNDYLADIARAQDPVSVYVGSNDELLDAAKLKIEFQSQHRNIPVVILEGLGHSDMVTQPQAIDAIVAAFQQSLPAS